MSIYRRIATVTSTPGTSPYTRPTPRKMVSFEQGVLALGTAAPIYNRVEPSQGLGSTLVPMGVWRLQGLPFFPVLELILSPVRQGHYFFMAFWGPKSRHRDFNIGI